MKTILVLTDFSINADHTAHYALKFAQKIKADLLLCNIYTVPADEKSADPTKWSLGKHEENSIDDLGELVARLKTQIDAGDKKDYRPGINQCSQQGTVTEELNRIVSTNNIFMVIISIHSANVFAKFLSANHTIDIIEKANIPVLVIPYEVRYEDYKTIAFATDMTETDIDVLQSISSLAKYSDSEILITNVDNNHPADQEEENSIKKFFSNGVLKIAYPKILYKAIRSRSVSDSLRWLTQHVEINLLVLVHRKQNFIQKLFEGSIIEKMTDHPAKPLLIFPYSNVAEPLPVF